MVSFNLILWEEHSMVLFKLILWEQLEKNSLSRLGILDIRLIQPREGVLHPILIVAWEHFECPVYDFR
jgi:hypothetical protein